MTGVEWLYYKYIITMDTYGEIDINSLNILFEQAKKIDKENLEKLKDFDTWKEWKNS